MNHIALDAADAVELIEILQYFIETLDRVTEHDAITHVIDSGFVCENPDCDAFGDAVES